MEGVTRRRCDLVVSGDDDDTDAGTAAFLDGVNDLLARWIQHADDSDERAVRLRVHTTHPSFIYVSCFSGEHDMLPLFQGQIPLGPVPRNFLVAIATRKSPTSYGLVTRKLATSPTSPRGSYEELVPVEFGLYTV